MTIQEIRKINKQIDELCNSRKTLHNWCEDMNSAYQLLDKFAEHVAIQKYEGEWHINANFWDVSHKSLPMAICLAFIKWKEEISEK